jgi:hypothetical protein
MNRYRVHVTAVPDRRNDDWVPFYYVRVPVRVFEDNGSGVLVEDGYVISGINNALQVELAEMKAGNDYVVTGLIEGKSIGDRKPCVKVFEAPMQLQLEYQP